jgi:hypothetical protein
VLSFIAVWAKNTIQIIAVTVFNFAFLVYAIIQIFELRQILGDNLASTLDGITFVGTNTLLTLPLNILTAIVIGNISVCSLILGVLAFLLRRQFG